MLIDESDWGIRFKSAGNAMSDTRELLGKIKDLRQRLTQVEGLVTEANQAAAGLLNAEPDAPLEKRLAEGQRRQALLDSALRQLGDGLSAQEVRPTQLIARVHRLLEQGREVVTRLRNLADDPVLNRGDEVVEESADDPLLLNFRDTASMTESALRLVQAYPDSPSAQMRLSDGLESIMNAIELRVEALGHAASVRRGERSLRDTLARLLEKLHAGEEMTPEPFLEIAEGILEEARNADPLHFLHAPATRPAEFVACHGITVARVASRMIRHDPEWEKFALDVAIAALLLDVGMLTVDPAILATTGPLSDEQKRAVEHHCRSGAETVAKYLPAAAPLCEAIVSHHERLDGTGYPSGLKDAQIGPMPRLLALADVYSARCCQRPHRSASDPRTALTDTLLLADRGLLDRTLAQRLLHLSFYPVGSVVEMADGSVGLVVATHLMPRQMHSPGKPVVAVLTDHRGKLLPVPRHLDLAECEGRAILRAIDSNRRRELLGRRYPELV